MITKKHIRFIQNQLTRDGFKPGAIDGVYGKKIDAALIAAGVPAAYSKTRKIAPYIQVLATRQGIEAGKLDGFWGPEYDAWWRCWESEGWVSLGRLRNFDWMHIQAAKL